MPRAARPIAALAAALALAWLGVVAWRMGHAETLVYDAAHESAAWTAAGTQPPPQAIERVGEDLERAARALPDSAAIEELLGNLAELRRERPDHLDVALAHFTRAVALRPTSPYAWAAVVRVKYGQGDTGRSFAAALRRAALLGPAEPEVQRTLVDYGLAVWDEVGADTRRAVEATVAGAMVRDPAGTLQVAERRGRLAIACRHVADAPRRPDDTWQKICASREPLS